MKHEHPPVRQPLPSFSIEMPANLEAVYRNLALIRHSPAELVFDFARILTSY